LPIQAVMFDLGGVLLPFDRERRVQALARHAGRRETEAAAFLGSSVVAGLFRRLDLGSAHLADFAGAFTDFAGRTVSEAQAKALILSVFEAPDAAAWALASCLRGQVRVGGLSDNPPFVAELFPPGARLDPMIFSTQSGVLKPSPEAFAAAERALGAPADAILLIDDAAANVEAARLRGWAAILYRHAAMLTDDLRAHGLDVGHA
jgi:FMN phosphatase YigB (HAD superfamily)